jgi:hypothetical protein
MSKIITDTGLLGKAIAAWGSKGAKWATEGQVLGLSALQRVADHGDIGYVNRLYLAMPKGTKSSAMASWLVAHGSLVANTTKGEKADKPFLFTKDKVTNMAAATADNWYDHKPEPDADQVFDLQKALIACLTKAGKATTVLHGELAEQVRALLTAAAGEAGPVEGDGVDDALSGVDADAARKGAVA